jgi:hypothetical protein
MGASRPWMRRGAPPPGRAGPPGSPTSPLRARCGGMSQGIAMHHPPPPQGKVDPPSGRSLPFVLPAKARRGPGRFRHPKPENFLSRAPSDGVFQATKVLLCLPFLLLCLPFSLPSRPPMHLPVSFLPALVLIACLVTPLRADPPPDAAPNAGQLAWVASHLRKASAISR